MSEPPRTFWDDLREDLKDPEFHKAYVEASEEVADADTEASIRRGVEEAAAGKGRRMDWVTDGVDVDGRAETDA